MTAQQVIDQLKQLNLPAERKAELIKRLETEGYTDALKFELGEVLAAHLDTLDDQERQLHQRVTVLEEQAEELAKISSQTDAEVTAAIAEADQEMAAIDAELGTLPQPAADTGAVPQSTPQFTRDSDEALTAPPQVTQFTQSTELTGQQPPAAAPPVDTPPPTATQPTTPPPPLPAPPSTPTIPSDTPPANPRL